MPFRTGGPQGGSLYKSTNGGAYWVDIAPPSPDWLRDGVWAIIINPIFTTTVFAGTARAGKICKTTDGGNTWTATSFQSGGGQITSIALTQAAPETLFATARLPFSGRLARSFDGATNWTILDVPNIRERNVLTSGSTIYLDGYDSVSTGYQGYILRSTDFGVTWTDLGWPTKDGSTIALAIDPSGSTIYLGKQDVNGGLYQRSTLTSVVQQRDETLRYGMRQNYPNPFNPTTTINFSLPSGANISLMIFDLLGRRVAELASGRYSAGNHSLTWNAKNISSGVYLVRLNATDANGRTRFSKVNKLVLSK